MTTHKIFLVVLFCLFAVLTFFVAFKPDLLHRNAFIKKYFFNIKVYSYFGFFISFLLLFRTRLLSLPLKVELVLLALLIILTYLILSKSTRLREMVLPESNPYQLSWYRIVICSVLLFMVLINDIRETIYIPIELLNPPSPLNRVLEFFGITNLRSESLLTFTQYGTAISLLFSILGLFTRTSLVTAALLYTLHYYIQICYTHFFHSGFVPLQMLYVLCIVGHTHIISLDMMLFKKRRSINLHSVQYALLGCIVIYGFSYFATGISKLYVDPFWAQSHNLKRMLLSDSIGLNDNLFGLDLVPMYVKNQLPDLLFGIIGVSALFFELAGFLFVFFKPARLWLPFLFFSLHIGIFLAQKFFFYDLLFLPIMFLPLGVILHKLVKIDIKQVVRNVKFAVAYPILVVSLFCSLIFSGWSFGWEKFPISSVWGMYAVSGYAELIWFKKIYAHTNSGEVFDTDLTDEIPLLNTAKWQDVTPYPEHVYKEHQQMLVTISKMLRNYAVLYNSKRNHEEQISHFDFRLIFWNFVKNPTGPGNETEGYESVIIPVDPTKEPYYERLHNHK